MAAALAAIAEQFLAPSPSQGRLNADFRHCGSLLDLLFLGLLWLAGFSIAISLGHSDSFLA